VKEEAGSIGKVKCLEKSNQ